MREYSDTEYIVGKAELEAHIKEIWSTGRISGLQEASHLVVQMLPTEQLDLSTALAMELLEAAKRPPYGFPF